MAGDVRSVLYNLLVRTDSSISACLPRHELPVKAARGPVDQRGEGLDGARIVPHWSDLLVVKKTSAMSSGLRTFIGLGLLTSGFLGSLATILAFFGSTSWFFDVLANFRFQLAIGLIVIGAAYFFAFGRWTAFIFVALGAVNGLLVAPLYLNDPAPAATGDSLRIVSFNVGAGRADSADLVDWMEGTQADLVFLLESTEDWLSTVEMNGSGYAVSNEIPDDRVYGISVLGSGPTVVEQLRLGTTRDPVMRVEATVGNETVAIYAVHPRPPDSAAKSAARDALFSELADLVDRELMPVIVIGDFNATPWSYAFRDFSSTTGLVNSQNGYGLAATWPTDFPISLVPLDHMLHSDSLTTVARDVGPDLGSDHLPLMVEVALASS